MDGNDHFNLDQTLHSMGQAVQAVAGHILFDAALHGLVVALIIALVGAILLLRKQQILQLK